MLKVEGPLGLDQGISVTFDSLGKTFHSRIAGTVVNVQLPGLRVHELADEAGEPPGYIEIVAPEWTAEPWGWVDVEKLPFAESNSQWGQVVFTDWTNKDGQPSGIASVSQARFWFDGTADFEGTSELGREVMAARDAWWSLVVEWVETISFQMVGARDDIQLQRSRALTRSLWTTSDEGSTLIETGSYSWHRIISQRPLTLGGLERAFELAGRGVQPSLGWQLLRDAHHAQAYGELRRAIVEMASALEVGSAMWLEHRLERTEAEIRKFIIGNMGTLGKRIQSMKEMGWVEPEGIKKVVQLRNQAVHAGSAPAVGDTAQALASTLNALKSFDPPHAKLMSESTIEPPAIAVPPALLANATV